MMATGYDKLPGLFLDYHSGHVKYVIEIEEGRYGRTVARVFAGEVEINQRMVESQHANEYCKYSKGYYNLCQ